jgi:hypothetical protein
LFRSQWQLATVAQQWPVKEQCNLWPHALSDSQSQTSRMGC